MTNIEIPDGLSEEAADLFADLSEDQDLTPAEWQAALQAARLVTMADRLDASVGEDLMIPGSAGQQVVNPAIAEARQARTAALAALNRIRSQRNPASAAGSALASNRWKKARHG